MPLRLTDDQATWDAFILRNGGGFLQSWGWSEFQRTLGRQVLRCRLEEADGEVAAQFALSIVGLPLGFAYATVPRGPVVAAGAEGFGARMDAAMAAINSTAAKEGAVFARVEPPFAERGDVVSADDMRRWGFRQAAANVPAATVLVDLTKSEDELLTDMHQKTRYNIRLAERHGVVVRPATATGPHFAKHAKDVFWNLLAHTAERDKFHTHERRHYDLMLDVLGIGVGGLALARPAGALELALWFAEVGGQPAAAAIVAYYGGTATYLHGASSAELRRHMAPHLLHWEIMREAKRRGCKTYDFWGVAATDDGEDPWAGITRFKLGFGGRRVGYLGAWELPLRPVWYSLYRSARAILRSA
ncbi:peptidoglycan bridge formation glycyltransferase FemA/FemB family protein [Candidatus Uhrbacteria bacterium]|nr:peptidoglycan bridge formation glycyltransferase FemA/FemB family protein [Candidatus Uhrbacteria bacterium]